MTMQTINDPLASGTQIQATSLVIGDEQITDNIAAIQEVGISLKEGSHDYVTIALHWQNLRIDSYIDKPVSFTFGPRQRFGRFYGYVTNITPSRNYKEDLMVVFECLGTTWTMRYGEPRFFLNQTISQVVHSIAQPHRLGTLVDEFRLRDRPYQWPTLAQTCETDFEFVVNLAHRLGFVCFVTDGVIRIVDPIMVLRTQASFATFIKSDEINDNTRTLLDFTPQTQSLQTRSTQSPKFGFFSSNGTGTLATVSSMNTTDRLETSKIVVDQLMADVLVAAWNNTPEAWSQVATARIVGNAEVTPGMLVSTQISGSAIVRNDYDGLWLVMGAEHTLTKTAFQTQLTLARTTTTRQGTPDYQQWFQSVQRPRPYIISRTLPDQSKRWESSWAGFAPPVLDTPHASTNVDWRGAV